MQLFYKARCLYSFQELLQQLGAQQVAQGCELGEGIGVQFWRENSGPLKNSRCPSRYLLISLHIHCCLEYHQLTGVLGFEWWCLPVIPAFAHGFTCPTVPSSPLYSFLSSSLFASLPLSFLASFLVFPSCIPSLSLYGPST